MAAKDTFTVRMRPDLKLQVQARAEEEGRSFANMLERLVEGALSEGVTGRRLEGERVLPETARVTGNQSPPAPSLSALTERGQTEGREVASTVPQPGLIALSTEGVAGSPPRSVSASAGGKVFRGPDVKAPGRKIRK